MMHYYGIVEDRNDPLEIGRVRVRVYGLHTENKSLIATPDLPWSQVILPTTSAGLSGFGTQHGLVEGSTVVGFFRDETDMQDFIVLGSVAGIPADGYLEDELDKLKKRTPDDGFSDPRRLTKDAYASTTDGANPPEAPTRPFGLEHGLDTAPIKPEKVEIKYDGKGSTITNPTLTEKDLPHYPLYVDESDISKYARGEEDYTSRDTSSANGIKSNAKPVYPYNKVLESESGHIIEIDDTRDAERIAVEHRSGTFQEIHPDGSVVQRIVNDNYQIVAKDDKIYIAGNADLTVEKGNVTINVNTGNVDMKVLKGNVTSEITEGNLKADILKGTTDVLSEGKITITGNNTTEIISDTTVTGTLTVSGATTLQSTLDVSGKQTNSSSITASGEVEGKGVKLSTHTHTISSGSSAGKTKKPD